MEAQMQQRNNNRAQPSLELRNVRLRSVSEAYETDTCKGGNDNQKKLMSWIISLIVVAIFFISAVLTYPPSIIGFLAELFVGILLGGALNFIFVKRNTI